MKICFLAHAASIHTRRWAGYFRDRGHRVSIVSLTPAEPEPGLDLYNLAGRRQIHYERTNWHYLLKLPQLWTAVRHIRPDLLNAHFLSSYGVLGALVRPPGCPLIVSLHGSDILVIPNKSVLHRWAARFALSRADIVTSPAEHMTQLLPKYMALNKPILTLQYGVDTRVFFAPSPKLPRAPLCLSNRALVSVSNLETLLLAAHELEQLGSPLQIYLAGEGDQLSFLKSRAAMLNLGQRVSFIGRVDSGRMPHLLRSAALYVSTSLSDGASLSLLEAMACGAFPVVSDIPANREWISDGLNGYLVSPRSPSELAQRLQAAWNQPALRQAAAEYNGPLIHEKGDYHRNMGVTEAAFKELLNSSRQ